MTPRQELIRNVVAILAVIAVAGLMSKCQGDRWQAKTDAALDTAAEARTQARVNAARAAEAENRANVATADKLIAQDRALRALAEANRLRNARPAIVPVASQPGAAPTVSDTLVAVVAQLENCEQETVALRVTIRQDSAASAASDRSQMELRGALALERQSGAQLTASNNQLATQLASADPPCRIAFWSCPSRKTMLVGGVVIGSVGTYLLVRK